MKKNVVAIEDLQVEDDVVDELKNEVFGSSYNFKYHKKRAETTNELINRIKEADALIEVIGLLKKTLEGNTTKTFFSRLLGGIV